MFATLPITATRSRIFVLNAMSEQSARKLPVFIRPLMLEITHQLTLAFLHAAGARADIALDTPVFEPVPVAARNALQAEYAQANEPLSSRVPRP